MMTELDIVRASIAVEKSGGYPTINAIAAHLGVNRSDIYGKVCGAQAFGWLRHRYDRNQPSGMRDGHFVTEMGMSRLRKSEAA